MKIAVFTDVFSPLVNGVITHLLDTTSYLAKKHEVTIFAPKPPQDNDEANHHSLSPDVQIEYLNSVPLIVYENARMALPFLPVTLAKIYQINPDIIHFHSPFTVGLAGIMTARILKIPLVGTFHGYFMEPEYLRIVGLDKIKLDNNRFLNSFLWKYSNFHYQQADVVISPSQITKNDLIKHGLKKPIKVVSNGIDLSEKKQEYKFKLPESYFLYIGRVSVEKSLDVLIKSFQQFSLKKTSVDLVIVGDGPIKNELQVLAKKLKIGQRVHFLGMIEHEKILRSNIFDKAVAFVTTSKSETQCISVLEAMNFGLPIIGVKSRALPELVKDNGIVCEPDNEQEIAQALILLCENQKQRNLFARNSRKLAKKHSIVATVEKLEQIYTKLVSSSPVKPAFF